MGSMYYIFYPFSWLLNVFYHAFNNYGLAVFLFALIVKIVLFPVTLKGKRSMIKMNMLSGKMEKLKKQYGKDQQRYNEEVQKLYASEQVNPMGGCLWSLLPLLILLPLYAIIRQPLKYLMGMNPDQINLVAQALDWGKVALSNGWIREAADTFANTGYNQLYLASLITKDTLPAVNAALGGAANAFVVNFKFLGVDLAAVPTWKVWLNATWPVIGGFLLVMVSTALSFAMSKVSTLTNRLSGQEQVQQGGAGRAMLWTMPLMSLWIGFSMPAALCVYWIANSVFTMAQELIAARMLREDYEKARIAAEQRAKEEKLEEKRRKEEARLERERRAEEEKANKKKGVGKSGEPGEEVNRDDSREGLRAYARGRAYVPDRFGGVTPYVDPAESIVDPKAKRAEQQLPEKLDLTERKENEQPADAQDDNKESV